MWTQQFWEDIAERAIKTFAQALLALVTVGSLLTDIDWGAALSMAATAALVSVLTSLASSRVGHRRSASLVDRGR
ncbi:holin [Nocardia otitidiscaviarum]|uniref:holin n=1 Tax=Nocardia otitidiscaviarum TaxID=1823 RepID=UPI001895F6EF|nr:holin [Nocardia otitidiscaviarum]MBF6138133.1 holin [Nocardia otitidiscaviarum]